MDMHAIMSSCRCKGFSPEAPVVVAGPLSCCPPSVGRRRGLEEVSPFGKFLTSGEVRNKFGRGRWEGEGRARGEGKR